MQYAATFGYRVWLRAAGRRISARAASRTTARSRRASACAAIPAGGGDDRARDDPGARARHRRARPPVPAVDAPKASRWCGPRKREGLPVTCDVAVHHLHLCDIDIGWFDAQCRLMPPLRGTRDRDALRAGLADGTIDLVCSDHTPVDDDGKQVPFGEAEPGATGLELLLPLTLKWAQEDSDCAAGGARADHVAAGGACSEATPAIWRSDAPADVCVFDPDALLDASSRRRCKSQGKNTPFLGLEVRGKVRYTLVGGQVVHEA